MEPRTDLEALDALIADMISESGEPGEDAEAWVEQAMMIAHRAMGRRGLSQST